MATIVTRSGKGSPLTHAEVDSNFTNLNTDKLELSGGTMTGNLSFGDNDKAIFGAGSDLQIYHDGANSNIRDDSGIGALHFTSNSYVFYNAAGTERGLDILENDEVRLYFDGSEKLATTSTGIDVTGTVTADGLTVDGDARFTGTLSTLNYPSSLLLDYFPTVTGTRIFSIGPDASTEGQFEFHTSTTSANKKRLSIASGGDISFYEDTGTTAKFFWDASAESLGIGTSSPATPTHISAALTGNNVLRIENTVSGYGAYTQYKNVHNAGNVLIGIAGDTSGDLNIYQGNAANIKLYTNNTERMRIDSSGNVGIGTSSPRENLTVENTNISDNGQQSFIRHNQYWNGSATVVENSSYGTVQIGLNRQGGGHLTFETGAVNTASSERMRIDSSGNVGIGTSSPDTALTVSGGDIKATGSLRNQMLVLARTDAANDYEWQIQGGSSGDSQYLAIVDNKGGSSTERMRIDSSGVVNIKNTGSTADFISETATSFIVGDGTGAQAMTVYTGTASNGAIYFADGSTGNATYRGGVQYLHGSDAMRFFTSATEVMRIDSSGNLLVGKASTGSTVAGIILGSNDKVTATRASGPSAAFVRTGSDGSIVDFQKDGSQVGSIGTYNSYLYIGEGDVGLAFRGFSDYILPWNPSTNSTRDNAIDIGNISYRFDDIYATNGTIQTSDQNEKQDIAELSEAEQRVAVAAKGLLRKFRWKDAVAEKGDEARTHFGIIAQDLQAAFAAEGLDAGDYAMFIHSTWTDEETGEERSRMGVRYSELLAFIIAAI